MSLNEALRHGGVANDAHVELLYVDSETVDVDNPAASLPDVDGVLVPGGFGVRGTEGKIAAIRYARESATPFFGICLGMQLVVVEYCRNVLGLQGAMSREFDADPKHPVVELMNEQREVTEKGGTMRLGAFPCVLKEHSIARRIYGAAEISERHRHRYEVNPAYHDSLKGELSITGWSPDGILAEIVELKNHPWFIGCQFHPEFKSRPLMPHPLFASFIKASLTRRIERQQVRVDSPA
jgi:CTP synthase